MTGTKCTNVLPARVPMVTRQFSEGGVTANLTLARVARSHVKTDCMIAILRGGNPAREGLIAGLRGHVFHRTFDDVAIKIDDSPERTTEFIMNNEADLVRAIRRMDDGASLVMRYGFTSLLRDSVAWNGRFVVVDMNYEDPAVQEYMVKQLAASISLFVGEIARQGPAVVGGAFEVFAIMESKQFSALATMLMDPEEVPGDVALTDASDSKDKVIAVTLNGKPVSLKGRSG